MVEQHEPKTIRQYVQDAKKAQRYRSIEAMAGAFGLGRKALMHWQAGETFPNETQMIELAKMGGNDPFYAILDLRCASSKDPEAQKMWKAHRWEVKKNAMLGLRVLAALAILPLSLTINSTSDAHTFEQESRYTHVMGWKVQKRTLLFVWLRSVLKRFQFLGSRIAAALFAGQAPSRKRLTQQALA